MWWLRKIIVYSHLWPDAQEAKLGCALWVGGMVLLSPINRSDSIQSWVSVRSRIQKRTDSAFFGVLRTMWSSSKRTSHVSGSKC